MILQRRSESLFVGLPCLWHFEGGRNRWAWIWCAYGWAVRAATGLYMRTSITQSDPFEALRTSYNSSIARRSCSRTHCWRNAVCVRSDGTCVSDTGTYAIVVCTICLRASRLDGCKTVPPLAITNMVIRSMDGRTHYSELRQTASKRKVQANECTACMHPAGTQTDASLPATGPMAEIHATSLTAPSSSPACSKRPAERPRDTRSHESLTPTLRTCGS